MDIEKFVEECKEALGDSTIYRVGQIATGIRDVVTERDDVILQLSESERSRTELIKQNQALAAENERLEVKLADSESGSISWRKSYHIALEKLVAAKAVIKAAQEQECDADRYRFIRSIGGITWTLSNKQDGELLRYRAEDEAYDSLVDEEIKARGFILKAHPVPAQSEVKSD